MTELAYPVTWRHSARAKRISLRIDGANRQVVVTCPRHLPLHHARRFLLTHDSWVREQLNALPAVTALLPGSIILLDDHPVTLVHAPEQRQSALMEKGSLRINGPIERFEQRVLVFLKHRAGLMLPAELAHEAERMSCQVSRFACSNARTRWGSCTRSGRVMLNWRLIIMPEPVRRYVMVHELAHLTHFDHSPAFWALVERFHEHRKPAQAWLRQHGTPLMALG